MSGTPEEVTRAWQQDLDLWRKKIDAEHREHRERLVAIELNQRKQLAINERRERQMAEHKEQLNGQDKEIAKLRRQVEGIPDETIVKFRKAFDGYWDERFERHFNRIARRTLLGIGSLILILVTMFATRTFDALLDGMGL